MDKLTFTMNPQRHKDIYLLLPVTQIIVNKTQHFNQREGFQAMGSDKLGSQLDRKRKTLFFIFLNVYVF